MPVSLGVILHFLNSSRARSKAGGCLTAVFSRISVWDVIMIREKYRRCELHVEVKQRSHSIILVSFEWLIALDLEDFSIFGKIIFFYFTKWQLKIARKKRFVFAD